MSPARQEELSALMDSVFDLDAVRDLHPDRRLRRIHYDWLSAGEVAQRTVAHLSEQLRRYLDDQAWLQNRRVIELIRGIEQGALAVRAAPPSEAFMQLDEPSPDIELAMERPLYSPPFKPRVAQQAIVAGDEALDTTALFEQVYVDKTLLQSRVRQALQTRHQISLADLVREYPIEQGLAELIAYLSVASDDDAAVIDDSRKQLLQWVDEHGTQRQATLPLIIFSRNLRTKSA